MGFANGVRQSRFRLNGPENSDSFYIALIISIMALFSTVLIYDTDFFFTVLFLCVVLFFKIIIGDEDQSDV
jgi:hypothetical protein